ncbi:uncharacterized protein LOC105155806 [Sesamum indicum]|uniref:Uncharacterized protein LOC105155806 n=1 Tax=Sesamum indicum TaxID=4182 RepID=A0A8M8UN56_SESIN|nr:uncharacterized protein LOC105155806 [Sesamum indicum]
MGKGEDEHPLPSTSFEAQGTTLSAGSRKGCCLGCSRLRELFTFRCVFILVLGVAVLLSAVFWLPFFHFGDHKDLDLDYGDTSKKMEVEEGWHKQEQRDVGHDIVASFMLRNPASFLEDNVLQLENDIFDEMSFSSTKVEIISLDITKVVFAVESDLTTQSLIKSSFVSIITHQSFLHLTTSLFGDPFSFEVLKFRGGITATPEQKAFLMQSVQILFNFTLNFSIDQTLNNFDELRSQLKTGLHLAPYENLYIRLTNLKGSTVAPPTTVQSQVVLAVGINPSKSRLKQLAQTITGSHHTKNLGLNNTVFGRVKQVRLSSILQHSLGGDGSGPSPSPSPSPLPQSHNHHHHHHRDTHLAPSVSPSPSMGSYGSVIGRGSPISSPVPAPAPSRNKASPPPACHFGNNNRSPWKHNKHSHMAPAAPPYAPDAAPTQPKQTSFLPPQLSPVPAASPPKVAYAHSQPPSNGESRARPLDSMPIVSPSPSPSSAGIFSSNMWTLLLHTVIFVLL